MNEPEKSSSGCGCVGGGCAGLLVALVLLLVMGYVGVMHTSLPLKWLASNLETEDDIQVHGISGSISKGVTIEVLRFRMNEEPLSELEGASITYDLGSWFDGERVIHEISVERAHLYLPPLDDTDEDEETGEDEAVTEESDTETSEAFSIESIDIKDVTIEIADTDLVLKLNAIRLEGLESDAEGTRVGPLTVDSSFFDFKMESLDEAGNVIDGMSSNVRYRGVLKTGAHSNVVRDVSFSGNADFSKKTGRFELRAFDGGLRLTSEGSGDTGRMRVERLTIDDYIRDLMPGRELSFRGIYTGGDDTDETFTMERGSVMLGEQRFEFAARTYAESEAMDATCTVDGVRYTCTFPPESDTMRIVPRLSSEPEQSTEDIAAHLLFGKSQAACTEAERADVSAFASRFSSD